MPNPVVTDIEKGNASIIANIGVWTYEIRNKNQIIWKAPGNVNGIHVYLLVEHFYKNRNRRFHINTGVHRYGNVDTLIQDPEFSTEDINMLAAVQHVKASIQWTLPLKYPPADIIQGFCYSNNYGIVDNEEPSVIDEPESIHGLTSNEESIPSTESP